MQWQLQRLTVRYCDMGGSSRGTREWIRTLLKPFAEANPQVQCVAGVARGRHPVVQGEYLKGKARVVSLRNKTVRDIDGFVRALRDTNGHKVARFEKPVFSQTPSVQGMWDHRGIAKRAELKIQVPS